MSFHSSFNQNKAKEKERKAKKTVLNFAIMKKNKEKITCITCYDATFAHLLENTKIDCVLVGDSLAQVVQGSANTLGVTIHDIAYHVRCVHSNLHTPLLVADMPFATACINHPETMQNAAILLRAGAEAVKIEGATDEVCEQIRFLTDHGVPVMGHIGLIPQSINTLGTYRLQGRNHSEKEKLVKNAQRLEQAGCFAIVLELLSHETAERISQSLTIPTIGIGAGNHCDGNILVLQDMLGMNPHFKPKFLKHFANLSKTITDAVNEYCEHVTAKKSEPE